MCSSKPKKPPRLPEAPRLPDVTTESISDKGERRRKAAASNTLLTGARGDTSTANTAQKTLLGA